ncbi:pseudouridine-metabolizing bifunctional protein C1861.05-like isoform X2 [Acanthaster planci]|uniref:Pseudouridine-metabolizing bifunctional protein C1861.05-like isoform X2 n=1 Tax=Acanthaster planci TaxID=133434 RepID=A0A8B7ZF02_ACAPL|nr:pseudouridine-metabolizing bifunctional protein C1861.05-like isoform X2 [Acanthaster planci]
MIKVLGIAHVRVHQYQQVGKMQRMRILWQKGSCLNKFYNAICKRYSSTWKILGANDLLEYHPAVASALSKDEPVVALESTIITHGMPYPHNLRMAQEVESIVAQNGVTPATIALMNGKLLIGLRQTELQHLTECSGPIKASRRDIAWGLSQGLTGGTTVSGTMIGAHRAGIPVFVTGGIGGVHRGGEISMDVSADLTELGRTPMAVISAGIKSILDIPRTLEYLETEGVTVAAFGPSSYFPAFFTPSSGYQAPIHVKCARDAAELIDYNLSLELGSGILIGVPIPADLAAEGQAIEEAIKTVLQEASDKGIQGKDVTPYILERVNQITKGDSLKANIALIKNNADIGSKIALELSYIRNQKAHNRRTKHRHATTQDGKRQGRPVVIGGSNVDLMSSIRSQEIIYGDGTNPGSINVSLGGVGRNVADCMTRLGASPLFLSAIGRDSQGDMLLSLSSHMDTSCISVLDRYSTATYSCVLNSDGQLIIAVGDMDISSQITPEYVSQFEEELQSAPLVCIDGNIPTETIEYVCKFCDQNSIPVWYEPTCIDKSIKPFRSDCWKSLSYISPNVKELCMIADHLSGKAVTPFQDRFTLQEKMDMSIELSQKLLHHIYCVVVTLGEDGVLVCRNADAHHPFLVGSTSLRETTSRKSAVHYPACTAEKMASVSGAGDCLAGGMLAGIVRQASANECMLSGLIAARASIQSYLTVPPTISTLTQSGLPSWQSRQLQI